MTPKEILEKYGSLESTNEAEAIDLICNSCIDAIEDGDFEFIDALLRAADVRESSTQLIVSLLGFTTMASDMVSYRSEFLAAAKREIVAREGEKRAESLLRGFERQDGARARRAWAAIMRIPVVSDDD